MKPHVLVFVLLCTLFNCQDAKNPIVHPQDMAIGMINDMNTDMTSNMTTDMLIETIPDMTVIEIDQTAQCQDVCHQLLNCAQSDCMVIDQDRFLQECQSRCESSTVFRRISLGLDQCSDILSFSEQQLGSHAELWSCSTSQMEYPACAVFARNYSRCLTERCQISDMQVSQVITLAYQHYCNEQGQLGMLNPDQLALAINDQSNCESGLIDQLLDERTQTNAQGMPGDLVDFCNNGPINPFTTCMMACERLSPCIPTDSPYASIRNQSRCQELCLAHSDPSPMTWQCLSELYLNDCASIGSCY